MWMTVKLDPSSFLLLTLLAALSAFYRSIKLNDSSYKQYDGLFKSFKSLDIIQVIIGRKISQSDENICQLDKVLISSGVVCLTSGIDLHLPAVCHNNKTNCS